MAPSQAPQAALTEAIGSSDAFLAFQEALSKVAPVNRPVLVMGERGTGKELAATRLHFLSQRWQQPLITLNCAALPQNLIESELFGHEAGAFTGATTQRKGRFELADGGTLFLDEIGLMPMQVQKKILRVIEYSIFERVGGSQPVSCDVRIVAATNADLKKQSAENAFKEDLLDRLSFEVLHVPPLRQRQNDVVLIANHFAARMSIELELPASPTLSEQALEQLLSYAWPGNVRECKNVIERAVYKAEKGVIHELTFDPFVSPWHNGFAEKHKQRRTSTSTTDFASTLPEAKSRLELEHLTHALKKTQYNQRKAAALMGLSYHQFRGLYRKFKNQGQLVSEL
ncbi:MAG: phage shock protein operon transcriptional activator [Chitinivibrionales bacterium]|nr:phage shock protein operon transcriptional activator [Chitinivibrionales bacterium]